MSYSLDDVDRQILCLLQREGRIPYLSIAHQLGLAEGTIRRRVARLLEDKIVRIVGVTDPFRIGMHTVAIVGIKVERRKIEAITNSLCQLEEVRYALLATGKFDLVVEIVVESNEALLEFLIKLGAIPGVLTTGTSLVLKVAKEDFAWNLAPAVP